MSFRHAWWNSAWIGAQHVVQMVVVDPDVALVERDVGVQDDLEPVTVHAPALVTGRDVWQAMRRLEDVAPPDMGVLVAVDVGPLVQGALDADLFDAGNVEMCFAPSERGFRRSVAPTDR